jgi:hypothetical protein
VADHVAIDDDLDRVALVAVQRRRLGQVEHLSIDADADEALPPGRLEDPVALGLAILDQRTEDEQSRALGQRQHLVDDLLHGLALDGDGHSGSADDRPARTAGAGSRRSR